VQSVSSAQVVQVFVAEHFEALSVVQSVLATQATHLPLGLAVFIRHFGVAPPAVQPLLSAKQVTHLPLGLAVSTRHFGEAPPAVQPASPAVKQVTHLPLGLAVSTRHFGVALPAVQPASPAVKQVTHLPRVLAVSTRHFGVGAWQGVSSLTTQTLQVLSDVSHFGVEVPAQAAAPEEQERDTVSRIKQITRRLTRS